METSSVEKKSDRYLACGLGWKVACYWLLLPSCAIYISLRLPDRVLAAPPPETATSTATASAPLTYRIVQVKEGEQPTTEVVAPQGKVELNSEQQEFDNNTQTIIATGNVVVRFNKALLKADRVQVNLQTKLATAEGNVSLLRGRQILYGDRFEYNLAADRGSIIAARGDIFQPTLVSDLRLIPQQGVQVPAGETQFPEPNLSDRLRGDQPVRITETNTTGVVFGSEQNIDNQPALKPSGGKISRLRFQADKVDFIGEQISAAKVRITNDPFSPPELQVKADRAQFKSLNSDEDEIVINNGRITIENNFDIPLIRDRIVLNKLGKDPNPFNIGFDGEERGGIFIERNFYPVFDNNWRVTVTPQYLLQRAISNLNFFDGSAFGVKTNVEANLSPTTTFRASSALTSLNLGQISNNLRAKAGVEQTVNLFGYNHTLTGESVYRDRIFNGSLGLQDLQFSIGSRLVSPVIPIGSTGVNLDYQLGANIITANTDRANLLPANTTTGLTTLSRYQAIGNLNKSFRLWEGQGLAANDREAYNYSPTPVIPYLQLNTGIRGEFAGYSSGDNQSSVGYSIGLQGQIGNFSKPSFDYTGFNISYFQRLTQNQSPFLFDRIVNNRILSSGVNQQLFGPVRLGIQTSLDLDNGKQVSTDYYLEYSRRTYNLILRYNPVLQLGSIGFRLNDFNWEGTTPSF